MVNWRVLVWIGVVGLCSAHGVYLLAEGLGRIATPFPLQRTEAFILDGVKALIAGEPLYRGLDGPPFVIHVYNPLTYLPTALAGRVLGSEDATLLLIGRGISLAATAALGLLGWAWLSARGLGQAGALLFPAGMMALAFLTATHFYHLRPEPLGLLLSVGGVLALNRVGRRSVVLAALLLWGAFMVKQSFIAAPVAGALFLLGQRRWRSAFEFLSIFAGLSLGSMALATGLSGGNYITNAIVVLASNDLVPTENYTQIFPPIGRLFFGIFLAWPLAVAGAWRCPTPSARLCALYASVAGIWAMVSFAKQGADINYFNEAFLAMLLCLAFTLAEGLAANRARGTTARRRPTLALVLAAALSGQVLYLGSIDGFLGGSGIRLDRPDPDLLPYAERYRRAALRPLIVEERIAVLVGKPVALDWYLLGLLEEKGLIELDAIHSALRRGDYDLVVLPQRGHAPRVTDELVAALKAGGYRIAHQDSYLVEFIR